MPSGFLLIHPLVPAQDFVQKQISKSREEAGGKGSCVGGGGGGGGGADAVPDDGEGDEGKSTGKEQTSRSGQNGGTGGKKAVVAEGPEAPFGPSGGLSNWEVQARFEEVAAAAFGGNLTERPRYNTIKAPNVHGHTGWTTNASELNLPEGSGTKPPNPEAQTLNSALIEPWPYRERTS